ncbi:hemolysin D [Polymorphobacter glacialis]|uniref:Hemolysin D n=1 Tax=Sandarakinorhabdus glacialis TaxID=1614636 RepID=A0A916ZIV0_9SPHN|nr:hemolysin D [Polymorphobacter glacialis]
MHNKLPDPDAAGVYGFPAASIDSGSRRPWLRPVVVAFVLAVVAFGLWQVFGKKPAAAPVVAALPQVTVIVPGTTAVLDTITAPGSIAARRDAAVGIQGDGGRVTAVFVDPGQMVAAGQVLARIDNSVQVQQSRQLAATIRSNEADAQLAQQNLDRAQALVSRGFVSKADVDSRIATRDGARARVEVAKAQLAEANARLARLDVRAPAAGLILSRTVEVGQVVSPGTALFRLAEGGVLEMRAQVAEQDIARLKVGMAAGVTPVGSNIEYRGRVWLLDPVIDVASRQGIARIALAYSPGLRVGAFAKASIASGEATRPVLPQSAVQVDEKGSYVLVVGAGNRVERRSITVGTVSDQGVAIASGLDGTEKIVASAGAFLRPGEKIAPVVARSAG